MEFNMSWQAPTIFWLLLLSGCGGGSGGGDGDNPPPISPPANNAPTISVSGSTTYFEGDIVAIDASSSSDSDGTVVAHSWMQTSGQGLGLGSINSALLQFNAPSVDTRTQFTFLLSIRDNGGATTSSSITVTVDPLPNNPPTAIGSASNTDAIYLDILTLDGSQSTDADGSITSYQWEQILGTDAPLLNSDNSITTFEIPVVNQAQETLTFRLTVTDNEGATHFADYSVNVTNQMPTAVFTSPPFLEELSSSAFNGTNSSDFEGLISNYEWSQISGPPGIFSNELEATANFQAPIVNSTTEIQIRLSVADSVGQISTTTHTINVVPKEFNESPTPIAISSDTDVFELSTVSLNGLSSFDSDGDVVTYTWSIQDCPAGTSISDTEQPETEVTFGIVENNTTCTISLGVTDNDGSGSAFEDQIFFNIDPLSLTISGTISAQQGSLSDSDVNDPLAPYTENDSSASAQPLPNPVRLGGYLNSAGEGEEGRSKLFGDENDFYRVNLLAGQQINVFVSDSNDGDIDLALWDSSHTFLQDLSLSAGGFESVLAPTDGEYLLQVYAFSGASNYSLVIGNSNISTITSGYSFQDDFSPNEMIVKFATPTNIKPTRDQLAAVALKLDAEIPSESLTHFTLLKLNNSSPENLNAAQSNSSNDIYSALARGLQSQQDLEKLQTLWSIKMANNELGLEYAQPNYLYEPYLEPNDPYYGLQWHYPKINLPDAWEVSTGTSNVIVAVVDTGVLLDHPDLQANIIQGYDFIKDLAISGDGDGIDSNADDPGDSTGLAPSSFHGSHVAGTIAGVTNNGVGTAGIAWNSKIMPIRVLGRGGGTTHDILQGVRYAAGLENDSGTFPAQAADIINLSLGSNSPCSPAEQEIFSLARSAGSVVVVAAGNSAADASNFTPASCTDVFTVSATGITNDLASYSNFGVPIDLAAPGGDNTADVNADGYPDQVLSHNADDSTTPFTFNYRFYPGTSMAAPHVAGVFALMKSINQDLTPDEFELLLQNGELTDPLSPVNAFGAGIINARKSVVAAAESINSPPVVTPTLRGFPSILNFGTISDTAFLEVENSQGGELQVTSVTNSNEWISTEPFDVDDGGLGTYLVQIDRTGLPNGLYSETIDIDSSANSIQVDLVTEVTSFDFSPNSGFLYVLLVDPTTFETVDGQALDIVAGQYTFELTNIPDGEYYIVAGTDSDSDGFICDYGESCGAYPSLSRLGTTSLLEDRNDLNFSAGQQVVVETSSQGQISVSPYSFFRFDVQESKAFELNE